ncbi:MAG: FAD-dependent oxidoreductase [Gammaproteobacteria bacterium]|nr:FAD-dependent oxidoreductase [Gammaproteobacteria bacterium]
MPRVDLKPPDLGESGWNAILPPRSARAALTADIECDYLVIGAGFAGLSAARRLRQLEPGSSIVILEAQAVAAGPAGRNSGFMIDLPHALASGSYQGDSSQDLRNIRMNRAAIAFAADAVREYGFAEESFDPCGKINAAAGRPGQQHNESYAAHLDALGEPYEMLDAQAMRDVCGSDYYLGGLRTPGTAVIQPALYIRSFADALVTQAGCRLFEHSPVQTLSRDGERWLARSATGSVSAPRVLLAVNGLIETFGFYRRRLLHINLYACWGFTPSDPIGSTLRRIDGSGGPRLVIRNRCTYEAGLSLPPDRLRQIARDHRRTFDARFPGLAHVEMEYCWSGRLCLSRNDVWALGELEPGLFSACCQNGLGTTRGTIAGIVAAEMASDVDADSLIPDFQGQASPKRLFPEPFMSLGARSAIKFKEWRAGPDL